VEAEEVCLDSDDDDDTPVYNPPPKQSHSLDQSQMLRQLMAAQQQHEEQQRHALRQPPIPAMFGRPTPHQAAYLPPSAAVPMGYASNFGGRVPAGYYGLPGYQMPQQQPKRQMREPQALVFRGKTCVLKPFSMLPKALREFGTRPKPAKRADPYADMKGVGGFQGGYGMGLMEGSVQVLTSNPISIPQGYQHSTMGGQFHTAKHHEEVELDDSDVKEDSSILEVLEDSSVQVVSSVEDMDQAPVILDISSLYTGADPSETVMAVNGDSVQAETSMDEYEKEEENHTVAENSAADSVRTGDLIQDALDAVALSADIVDEEVVEAAPVEAAEEAVEASAVPLPDDSTEEATEGSGMYITALDTLGSDIQDHDGTVVVCSTPADATDALAFHIPTADIVNTMATAAAPADIVNKAATAAPAADIVNTAATDAEIVSAESIDDDDDNTLVNSAVLVDQ